MRKAGIIVALLVAIGAALAMAQRPPSAPNADAGEMMSNVMIPGFDPAAGLRAAQASRDPAARVEVLLRPGTTMLERVMGAHRAQAILEIERLPAKLDPERWPVTTLIGEYLSPEQNYVVATIALQVDGCAIALPMPGVTGFRDPRSVGLGRSGKLWTLRISNNGDSEAYTAIYSFDDKSVVAQQVDWGGSSMDARLKIDEDDYGAGRDCVKVGTRTAGARAELKAGSPS